MTEGTPDPGGFRTAEDELEELEGGGTDSVPPIAAADGSQLASLRERRQKVVDTLYFDLEVPRYDPPVFVRYKPVDAQRIDATLDRTARQRDKNRSVNTNAIILASACMGVFEVINGVEVSVDPDDRDGEWPVFGPELAAILGVPMAKKASEVVKVLYLTDGDLISTADDLQRRSGYLQSQQERDDSGN